MKGNVKATRRSRPIGGYDRGQPLLNKAPSSQLTKISVNLGALLITLKLKL